MSRRDLRLLLTLAAIAPLLGIGVALVGSPELLLAAPLLVLLLPLLAGRYVGEEAIARLRGQAFVARRTRRDVAVPAERPSRVPAPRGGRLIACSLAVRPPPFAVPA